MLPAPRDYLRWRFLLASAGLALGCGLTGAAFSLVIVSVERVAFGFSTGTLAEAITEVSALHRFTTVLVAGVLVAGSWYLLRRYGPSIPSPAQIAGAAPGEIPVRMRWMLADTALQVLNVAAGASIGREGAPRQVGALAGSDLSVRLGLTAGQRQVLVACGAGAGLAAIYDVPVGGALFSCEVMLGFALLRRSRPTAVATTVLAALAISWLATVVARIAVPDRPTYTFDAPLAPGWLLIVVAVVGPVLGALGYGFAALLDRVARQRPRGARILWTMPLCYLGLAALAVPLPLVLGNGHALAENVFTGAVPLAVAAMLVVAKPLATLLTVRAGAAGGRLTPALSTGAAAGAAFGGVAALVWPVPVTAVAVLGSAAFLTGAVPAPLTAAVLVIEFTGLPPGGWPLVALSVAGGYLAVRALRRWQRGRRLRAVPSPTAAESPHD